MALRNISDGKRLGDSLRALEEIQRRADSLIAGHKRESLDSDGAPHSNGNGNGNGHAPHPATNGDTPKPLTETRALVEAESTDAKPALAPQDPAPTATPSASKVRDPFLDSLEALRKTLRNQPARADEPAPAPGLVEAESTPVNELPPLEALIEKPADPEPTPDATAAKNEPTPEPTAVEAESTPDPVTQASDGAQESPEDVSALERMPLPELDRAPTPLPQVEEDPAPARRQRTPIPPMPEPTDESLYNALDAVRASVGLPKPEPGRISTPSTPRPRKRRPMSDGIPKSVSEDLPKFRGKPRMRICNRCGHETRLRDPECQNCGKVDESLGILDAVISGDLAKVEQILLVRPHLIAVQTNRHAWTLLHMAASGGNRKMAELLIAKGAAVNAPNRDGKTPLHYAAGKGHLNVVEALLAHHADPDITYNGKTAADVAHAHSQHEVETYLRNLKRDEET